MGRFPEGMARNSRDTSWTAILDALYAESWSSSLHRFRAPFAFRGMGREDHALTSSLVRLARGADVTRLEMALLRNFRKYAISDGGVAADSIWDWLALGQHRGLPTRLLDWTYSPLVALHFATEAPEDMGADGVVWCVNFVEANKRLPPRLRRIMQREGSETLTIDMLKAIGDLRKFDALASGSTKRRSAEDGRKDFLVFMEPPALDRRILNQWALFSLMSSPTAVMDAWLAEHPDLCRRVRIPAGLKWEIRDKLDQANVNERILFPDLDGLSRWLTRYYLPAIGSERLNDAYAYHPDFHARDRNRRPGRAGRPAARRPSRSTAARR
jgi:FRG domain